MKAHEGMVFHAAAVLEVFNAAVDVARWVAQRRVASGRGRSLAKLSTNTSCLSNRFEEPSGASGSGTASNSWSSGSVRTTEPSPLSVLADSPTSGAYASTKTSALTLGLLSAASVITDPP